MDKRDIKDRFWEKVIVAESNECWLWKGCKTKGYGILSPGQQHASPVKAHRLSWEIANGPVPRGLVVRHSCDNPPCVNPNHLLVGSMRDNAMDAVRRGRNYTPTPQEKPRGELHGIAKLTSDEVRSIRELRMHGWKQHELASKFKVTRGNIRKILTRETWAHI